MVTADYIGVQVAKPAQDTPAQRGFADSQLLVVQLPPKGLFRVLSCRACYVSSWGKIKAPPCWPAMLYPPDSGCEVSSLGQYIKLQTSASQKL